MHPGNNQKHYWINYAPNSTLQDLQVYGTERKQSSQPIVFNSAQKQWLQAALYGLKPFKAEVIHEMPLNKKLWILRVHEAAQDVLHRWKQQIMCRQVDQFLLTFFPKSPTVQAMINIGMEDEPVRSQINLRSLGLTQEKIANRFIEEKIFPENFYQLTCND